MNKGVKTKLENVGFWSLLDHHDCCKKGVVPIIPKSITRTEENEILCDHIAVIEIIVEIETVQLCC